LGKRDGDRLDRRLPRIEVDLRGAAMDKQRHASSAMEGHGAYNRNAKLPAGGGALAAPFFARAAERAEINGDTPIVVADYGSSQGKNSLGPMRGAIERLRNRAGKDRAILIYHEDRPSNDFNALFEVLDADLESYAKGDARIYPSAIGRSFYENVLPHDYVHLGWSSYAAMWISSIPATVPDHFAIQRSPPEIREHFDRQAIEDWRRFLSLRAMEMRAGARLVVAMPGADDSGESGFDQIMDQANEVLLEMANEGAITRDDWRRMTLGVWPRRKAELVEPFANGKAFQSLVVEECETALLSDAAWSDYERDGDRQALATKHAAFFRTIFAPSLAMDVERVRGGEGGAFEAFADRLSQGLTERRAADPAPIHSLVQIAVFAKQSV
jgi:hypothetical protein